MNYILFHTNFILLSFYSLREMVSQLGLQARHHHHHFSVLFMMMMNQFDTLIVPHWLAVIPEYLKIRISILLHLGDHDNTLVRIIPFPHDRLEIFDVRARDL